MHWFHYLKTLFSETIRFSQTQQSHWRVSAKLISFFLITKVCIAKRTTLSSEKARKSQSLEKQLDKEKMNSGSELVSFSRQGFKGRYKRWIKSRMPSSSNMRLCWYLLEKKQGANFSVCVRQINKFMQRQSPVRISLKR